MATLINRACSVVTKSSLTTFNELTVAQVKEQAATEAKVDVAQIRILYRGQILKQDDKTLEEVGIKKGSNLHAIKKPRDAADQEELKPKTLSEEEMQRFFVAFGMAVRNPNISVVIKKMTERDSLESLAAACPGLAKDDLALALLSKPEMLIMLMKPETLQKIAKEHPSLTEAMSNLAAAVHEEKAPAASSSVPNPFAYHLDDPSDDDMDDDEAMPQGGAQGGLQRNRSQSAITANQLAAALAAATNASGPSNNQPGLGGPFGGLFGGVAPPNAGAPAAAATPSSSGNSSGAAITSDMFRAAMSQAMATVRGGGTGQEMDTSTSNTSSIEDKLKTMKDMGIVENEEIARKALILMDGDVQAAVDLILSGWKGDDDSTN